MPLPIFLDLTNRTVLLLGEGEAAERRAATFQAAGATIRRATGFTPTLLDGVALAAGTGAPEADLQALSAAAQARGIPVNIVDRPELSSYLTPSTIERGELQIAVSTGGAAPILARLIRQKIEALIPPAWENLVALARRLQAETRAALPDTATRRRRLEAIFAGPAADLALAGNLQAAEVAWRAALTGTTPTGIVHLVGAGPGSADLATLRALRLLGEADTIVHDRLGTEEVLRLARRDAHLIDVGKSQGDHTMPQAEITALLIRLARAGQRVVRLKGGDPFVFGRGGEEFDALTEAGIPCVVTPGVTAATACAASAGVPLTHRDRAHAVTFVTAHRRRPDLGIDFARVLQPGVTLAIYMGLATLDRLCAELTQAGLATDLGAVLVENGGTARARVLRGPLCDLARQAPGWSQGGPALILLGGAANSHNFNVT